VVLVGGAAALVRMPAPHPPPPGPSPEHRRNTSVVLRADDADG
jgi:hypothetical protein